MGSAHPLFEVNVSFKFEENPSISKGVIERTQIGDGPTDRPTDATKRIQYSPPPTFCGGGIITYNQDQPFVVGPRRIKNSFDLTSVLMEIKYAYF